MNDMQDQSAINTRCDKTIYEQCCEDFRSLNEIMWRVPILVMSLTGGLGVAIATFDLTDPARRAILIFAGLVNIAFVLVLFRLRGVMDRILKQIHLYQGTEHRKGFFVVCVLSSILVIGMLGCFYSAYNVTDMFRAKMTTNLECTGGTAEISIIDQQDSERVMLDVVCNSKDDK